MPGYCHQLSAQWVRATDDKQVEECSDIGMSHCATIKIPARALAQQTRRRPATRQLRLSTEKSEYTCGNISVCIIIDNLSQTFKINFLSNSVFGPL